MIQIAVCESNFSKKAKCLPKQLRFFDYWYCSCDLGVDYQTRPYIYTHWYYNPQTGVYGYQPENGWIEIRTHITMYYLVVALSANNPIFACREGSVIFWSANANATSTFYGNYTGYGINIYDGGQAPYTYGGGSPMGTYPRFAVCNPNGW